MNLCIKNELGAQIVLDIPSTSTIKQIIEALYLKNVFLKDFITSKVYEHSVQLSLNGAKLDLERTLTDYGIDVRLVSNEGINASSDLELRVIDGVNIPGLSSLNLINLDLEAPEIPEELRCPLSTQIFRDPVLLPCGTLVEKGFVLRWAREKGRCPFTRRPLSEETVRQLEPDIEVQAKVGRFLQGHSGRGYFKELKELQYKDEDYPPLSRSMAHEAIEPDIDDRAAIDLALRGFNARRPQEQNPQAAISNWRRLQGRSFPNRDRFMLSREVARGLRSIINYSGNEHIERNILETVTELQDFGITKQLLIEHWQPHHNTASWDGFAQETLIYLLKGIPPENVTGRNPVDLLPENLRLEPVVALQEMTRLSANGMQALCKLYLRGLRGHHLRALDGNFDLGHKSVLIELVTVRNVPLNDALQQITGISENQAWDIYRGQPEMGMFLTAMNWCGL